jgi:hypothetical protein
MLNALFVVTFGMLSSLLTVGTVVVLLWAAVEDGKRNRAFHR